MADVPNTQVRQAKITCEVCKETQEYEEHYWMGENNIEEVDAESVPDGYFVPHPITNKWVWVCDGCGSCPVCGSSRVEPRKPRCEHQIHTKEDDDLRWKIGKRWTKRTGKQNEQA